MTAPLWEFPTVPGQPLGLDLALGYGAVRLVATSTTTVQVRVRPAAAGRRQDEELAAATVVDLVGGQLTLRAQRGRLSSLLRPGAVEVTVVAPQGSSVTADIGYAHLVAEGAWDSVEVRSAYGDVRLDSVRRLEVSTSGGSVALGSVTEVGTIRNTHGTIRISEAAGQLDLRNTHGDTWIGQLRGRLVARATYGSVTVERALAGSVEATTSYGVITVGIAAGTAARLDLHADKGNVVNSLTPTGSPASASNRLELTARSGWGDIIISRATRQHGEARP